MKKIIFPILFFCISLASFAKSNEMSVFPKFGKPIQKTWNSVDDEFKRITQIYQDSLNNFTSISDQVIGNLSETEQATFFTMLDNEGVSSAASQFNLNESDVQNVARSFNAVHLVFQDLAKNLYGGNTDHISQDQLFALIDSVSSTIMNKAAPGPCQQANNTCIGYATDTYEDRIVGCTGLGLGIATAAPVLGLISGLGCISWAAYKYNKALHGCEDSYTQCLIDRD